ncbi:hypothetical protein D3C86_2139320 [compost metagenome]
MERLRIVLAGKGQDLFLGDEVRTQFAAAADFKVLEIQHRLSLCSDWRHGTKFAQAMIAWPPGAGVRICRTRP